MLRLEVGNENVALRLAVGVESGQPLERGILVESIRDVRAGRGHEYLVAPTFLFEFAVDDGPPRLSSRDLIVVENHVVDGREVRVHATAPADDLAFQLNVKTDADRAAILVALAVTNLRADSSVIVRMVVPKILGLRVRGGPCDTVGMVSMEIGSNVRLAGTLVENGKPDEKDGTYNPGTVGMPYRREAKRVGLPTDMNTMELACFYDAAGGGLFIADIDHDVESGVAPVQLTVSLLGVEGYWVSELPPSKTINLPRLAIGVHSEGDWHEAVDYYLAKHRGREGWTFPPPPAWFRDQGAIYTHSGGGAGGMYLSNTIENLPDGAVATFFEVDGKWPPAGPVPFTQAGLAPAGAPLAVAVRDDKHEDLFVVDRSGAIAWASMRDNGPWRFPAVRITPEQFAPVGAALVAVARHGQQVDVFVVSSWDGAVWTVFGPAITGKPWHMTRVSEANIARPGAPLAAITRGGQDVDVFVVDHQGAVRWTFERGNGPWLGQTRQITTDNTCVGGGNLVALVRNPVQTDVFFIDAGGRIATVFKTTPADDGRWETARVSEWLTRAGAGIAATTRHGKDEDVFVLGNWGDIQHTAMRDNRGWSPPTALEVPDGDGGLQRDGFAPAGAPITALAGPNRTDLFFVDGNGALAQVVQDQDTAEWRRPDVAPSLNLFTAPGAATAAVTRNSRQADVFLVTKGRLRSFIELPDLLSEARSLGTDIVYLWDYWEGTPQVGADASGAGPLAPLQPPYFNKGDYIPRADLGGEDALKEGIRRVHALGGKVVLYVEPFIIFCDSYVARFRPNPDDRSQGQYLAGRYPTKWPLSVIASHDEQGREWSVYDCYHTMVPALPEWQAHVLKVVDRLVHGYGADGIFLDSFGWQMNWPMRVDYRGPEGHRELDCWPVDYARGVLALADKVMQTIGPDRVVLVETPSGPMARHCHGGVSADFAFHVRNGLSNQDRITASAVRYGIPEVRYFSNGGDSMNRLHQVYAAGHGLALCHQHILEENGSHVGHLKHLVDIRRTHADALIHGQQTYQPQAEGPEDVAAYCYRGPSGLTIITVVNTSEEADYTGRLALRAEHADSAWTDLIGGGHFTANGAALQISVPRGGRSKTDNLLVLQQARP